MHISLKAHSSALSDVLKRFSAARILIVGDIMLDRYVKGDVRRVSPEAPVPVVETSGVSSQPGGAANVAANVAMLGAKACLVGLIGRDHDGAELKEVLCGLGISGDKLVIDDSRPTTTKTRVVAGTQQICRFDRERRAAADPARENELIRQIDDSVGAADACIVSDYDKGCLTGRIARHVIVTAMALGKPVVVDPKVRDFSKYAGCTVITPNVKEAEVASGEAISNRRDAIRAAKVLTALSNSALLLTLGADGMSLFQSGEIPLHLPAQARRVFDVTGAGDTVVGALALGLAVGADLAMSALLANTAAGIVVQKPGTAQVTSHEVLSALTKNARRRIPALQAAVDVAYAHAGAPSAI
jgi:rfaE bifunctional protein kinase chain/domain